MTIMMKDIRSIVSEMDAYFEAHPEMKDEIYRTDISIANYAEELISLVLEGEPGKSYDELSEDERGRVEEIAEAITESASTWNTVGFYDYLAFEQIDMHESTGLYDKLYNAVIEYWTQDGCIAESRIYYIAENHITIEKIIKYLDENCSTANLVWYFGLHQEDDEFEADLYYTYSHFHCEDEFEAPQDDWKIKLHKMVSAHWNILADDILRDFINGTLFSSNIIYAIADATD